MIGWIRLVIALFCVLLATLLLVPVQLLAMRTGWYSENFARGLWHRINVRALGFRVHVVGEMTPQRPLLIASNHVSWTDIEVMASLFDMTFIAKSDIDAWPAIGRLFRLQRPIYVERNRKRKTGRAGKRNRKADGRRPADRSVSRRHDGRRQHDFAVQEFAFRRGRHVDREWNS